MRQPQPSACHGTEDPDRRRWSRSVLRLAALAVCLAGSLEGIDVELSAALEREVTAVFLEGQKPSKEALN